MFTYFVTIVLSVIACIRTEELTITLNGTQFISLAPLPTRDPTRPFDSYIQLLFRTIHPTSLLYYTTGNSGEHILLELIRGKLRCAVQMSGSKKDHATANAQSIVQDHLSDNDWHQVDITIRQEGVYVHVDTTKESAKFNSTPSALRLKKLYVGGLSSHEWTQSRTQDRILSKQNYSGCLSHIKADKLLLLRTLHKKDPRITTVGNLQWNCDESAAFEAINFSGPDSFLQTSIESTTSLHIQFSFRTYHETGMLLSTSMHKRRAVLVYMDNNLLRMRVGNFPVLSLEGDNKLDEGKWHYVEVTITNNTIKMKLDSNSTQYKFAEQQFFNFSSDLMVGKKRDQLPSFVGCMLKIIVNGKLININNVISDNFVTFKYCKMKDFCFPNPCNNKGKCVQMYDKFECRCKGTGYVGRKCELEAYKYKRSCEEYYNNGLKKDRDYYIKPGLSIFKVYCHMSHPFGPATIVEHDHPNYTSVAQIQKSDSKFFYHLIKYKYSVSPEDLRNLTQISENCRQHIIYNCMSSTLMFSIDPFRAQTNRFGVRWYSGGGIIQSYWGGATKGSLKCACGMTKTCASEKLNCNCDKMDKVWRIDEGYLTYKDDLPVTKLQFSKLKTTLASNYRLGPLECFGKPLPSSTPTSISTTSNISRITLKGNLRVTVNPARNISNSLSTTSHSTRHTDSESKSSAFIPRFTNLHLISTTIPGIRVTKPTQFNHLKITHSKTKKRANSETERPTANQGHPTLEKGTTQVIIFQGSSTQTESFNSNQMLILIIIIACVVLFAMIIIAALLRQRLFSCKLSGNKIIKTEEGKESTSTREEESISSKNNKRNLPDSRPDRNDSDTFDDLDNIEEITLRTSFRHSLPSGSETSVSSNDTSRYLEIDGESDNVSCNSFRLKERGRLLPTTYGTVKDKHGKFIVSRPRSTGDNRFSEDQGTEVIGLLHMNQKSDKTVCGCNAPENSQSDFDLSKGRDEYAVLYRKRNSSSSSRSTSSNSADIDTIQNIEEEAGFITDSSASGSRKSFASASSSVNSNEELQVKNYFRQSNSQRKNKRSVRFSLSNGLLEYEPEDKVHSIGVKRMSSAESDDVFMIESR